MLSALLIVGVTVAVFAFINVRSLRNARAQHQAGVTETEPPRGRRLALISIAWIAVVVVVVLLVLGLIGPGF